MTNEGDLAVSVRFWGARGSIPSPGPETGRYGANTSCVEVRADDQILILDAGSGIRRLGAKLAAEFKASGFEATLILSHTHWDHIQGLPFFTPAYCERNRIRICTPPGRRSQIERALHNQMDPIHFPVEFRSLGAITGFDELPARGKEIGHVRVRAINVNHPGGSGGFRLDVDGLSIGFVPDHEPYHSITNGTAPTAAAEASQRQLAAFLRGCDLLMLDTQYDEAEYPTRVGWGHGCVADSVALAIAADVRELVLFHHDPAHSDGHIAQIVSRAKELIRRAGSRLIVRAACEGEEIRLLPTPPRSLAGAPFVASQV